MASQLIKVTNSYSGEWWYLVQDKIMAFYANTKPVGKSYAKECCTWVVMEGHEEAYPIYESVEYFLGKFPPV